jgi:hypothetical protein
MPDKPKSISTPPKVVKEETYVPSPTPKMQPYPPACPHCRQWNKADYKICEGCGKPRP